MSIQTELKNKFNSLMAGKTESDMDSVMANNEFVSSLSETEESNDGENTESTGAASAGGYSQPLFGKKVETKEATSSSSAGAYDAPGFEDVQMKGNHERGSGKSYKKTQIPGGKFVQVKKKCKKFPYCNQGDINALKIFENELLKKVIQNVSKKMNVNESVIKNIIAHEYRKLS